MKYLILKPQRCELVEKQSRFIAIALPCASIDAFKLRKAELELEFPDARHITYAYIIQDQDQIYQRFHDADEPAGTAGRPILMHISGRQLFNIVIFVVRYFGGIKLGAGGLMRAYGAAARQVLDEATLAPFVPLTLLTLELPYSAQNRLDYLAKKHGAVILDRTFSEQLVCRIQIPLEEKAAFLALLPSLVKEQEEEGL